MGVLDGDTVQAFEIPAPGPLIESQHVEGRLPTGATLAASLNPEGHETTYHFEYDTTPYEEGEEDSGGEPPHGAAVPVHSPPLPAGYDDTTVEADLGELTPDTIYHFRLVATNHCDVEEPARECTVYGPDTAFRTGTAIDIEAQWVSALSIRDATVEASLDPLGAENAILWVEYDTSPYGEGERPHGVHVVGGSLPASVGALHRRSPLRGPRPGHRLPLPLRRQRRPGRPHLLRSRHRPQLHHPARGVRLPGLPDDRAVGDGHPLPTSTGRC